MVGVVRLPLERFSVPADAFELTGGGVISPGLGVTPRPQAFNFAGAGPAVGTDTSVGVGVANCFANGADAVGTIEFGEGNLIVTCTIGPRTFTVNATFVRVAAAVVVVSANAVVEFGAGVCGFVATGTPPVTAYQLTCGAAYVQQPS